MQACTMLYTPKLEVDSPEHGAGILVLTGVWVGNSTGGVVWGRAGS
jgi:hypothetical protein